MRPVLKGLLVWLVVSVPVALWAGRALKARQARPEWGEWEPLVRPVNRDHPANQAHQDQRVRQAQRQQN